MLGLLLCASTAMAQPKQNVLLICIDDLRPELNCFGETYIQSPNIDQFAKSGRSFHRHYVNAPSCGPSRYAMLTGRYAVSGKGNEHLYLRGREVEKTPGKVSPSMPEWFRKQGYTAVSVGKVSHYPGGRCGKGWADDSILELPKAWDRHLMPVGRWKNPQGTMHGYANGKIRKRKSKKDFIYEAVEGPDTIYPDGLIAKEGLKQLEELAADEKPFFLAIGLIKPHLPFGAPKKYLDLYEGVELPPIPHPQKPAGKTTWNPSWEFMSYTRWGKDPNKDEAFATEVRRHYAACVSYADKHVGDILSKLKETGADKNTIVILWGDHGWHLGEHAIWGKHSLFEESLHSPLIVYYPGIEKAGQKSDAVVETVDIFPTVCELTNVPVPEFAQGSSLQAILDDPDAPGHSAFGYYDSRRTLRTATHRLIEHEGGAVELYDHTTPEMETFNIAADNSDLVEKLKAEIADKLSEKELRKKSTK